MFTKLLKYEWRSNATTFGILSLCALGVSVLGGVILRLLIQYGEQLNAAAAMGLGTLVFFAFLSLIGYAVAIEIMLLVRFYKNKFTDEGYLTFTLPVSSHQIFLSSLVNMLLWTVIASAVLTLGIAVLLLIALAGINWSDVREVLRELALYFEYLYPQDYWIISLLQTVVSLVYSCILSMTCLTVGAVIAKKHKILAAFGIYYGISVVMGTFESILTVAFSLSSAAPDTYLLWVTPIISMVVQLIVVVAGYFTSTYLMKRKLNLS